MNILVTGGAGYVGSACLRYLIELGHSAVAYDNLIQGHPEAVPGFLIQGDVLDTQLLTESLRDVAADAVMHFAAATCVGESVEQPEYHYRNNVAGTLSLLSAMRAAGVKKLLFSSTCATYGDNPRSPMDESTAQMPCSPYARTKLAVEWMIADFAAAYGMGFTILRYFNAAGASPDGSHGEDHDPENHLIPLILQVALKQREQISIFGDNYATPDGTCVRDYVHVNDLAKAHSLAIDATTPETREVFNVGTGHGHSVKDIVRACEAVVGELLPCKITERRPGDPPTLVADPNKLIRQLGWKPEYADINSIIGTAWEWHRRYPGGYRPEQKKSRIMAQKATDSKVSTEVDAHKREA